MKNNPKILFLLLIILIIANCKKEDIDKTPPAEVSDLQITEEIFDLLLIWVDPVDNDFQKVIISFDDTIIEIQKGIQKQVITNLNSSSEYTFHIKTQDLNENISNGISISGSTAYDYRNFYIGDYFFEVISEHWFLYYPTRYDTGYCNGTVKLFEEVDYSTDLAYEGYDPVLPNPYYPSEDNNLKVTIKFSGDKTITPEILSTGIFKSKQAHHYNHDGYFKKDSLLFSVRGLGGLGFSTSLKIKGIKY